MHRILRTVLIITIGLGVSGCKPKSQSLVGIWVRPLGFREWDGQLSGETYLIEFSKDGTYQILTPRQWIAYADQYSELIETKTGTGWWNVRDGKLFLQTNSNVVIPINIIKMSRDQRVMQFGHLKDVTFYRYNGPLENAVPKNRQSQSRVPFPHLDRLGNMK